MYATLKDIPQFPHANWKANLGWNFYEKWLAGFNKVDLNPDYQRGYVWSEYQKEKYIEYCLKGGRSGKEIFWNIPNFNRQVGNTEWHNTLELVDGKQRLNAVKEFLSGKVKAFGKFISDYPDNARLGGIRYDFIFHINELSTKREVVEWYLGMNAGGSIHTEQDLKVARDVLAQTLEN